MTGKTTGRRWSLRSLVPFIVWGSLLIAGIIVLGPPLWTYARGAPATARVDFCRTTYERDQNGNRHYETTCYGTWTLDGTRHSGRIDGAHPGLVHRTVPVRALDDRAAMLNTLRRSLLVCGGMAVIGVIAHIATARAVARTRRT